jgi:hypothetical protein
VARLDWGRFDGSTTTRVKWLKVVFLGFLHSFARHALHSVVPTNTSPQSQKYVLESISDLCLPDTSKKKMEGGDGSTWDPYANLAHVEISGDLPVQYLSMMARHPPGTPFTKDEQTVGLLVWASLRMKIPPYMSFDTNPDHPHVVSLRAYYTGRYTQVDLHIAIQQHGAVQVRRVQRAGTMMDCSTLFYFVLKAMDPSVEIPAILRTCDQSWRPDLLESANMMTEDLDSAKETLDRHAIYWNAPVHDFFELLRHTGATLAQAFRNHPNATELFVARFQERIEQAYKFDPVELFQWESIMAGAVALHRMIQGGYLYMSDTLLDLYTKLQTMTESFGRVRPENAATHLALYLIQSWD